MSYRAKALREQISDSVEQIEALLARDQLSPEARAAVIRLQGEDGGDDGEIGRMWVELQDLEQREARTMSTILSVAQPGSVADLNRRDMQSIPIQQGEPSSLSRRGSSAAWQDAHGRPIHCLAPSERLADLPRANSNIPAGASFGEFIKVAITGDLRNASPGIRAAMSEQHNAVGGILVPDEFSRTVVDLARARSVVFRGGAKTIPMTSDSLIVARVASDPTFELKEENAAFTPSDITFDNLEFHSKTIGCLITCSRELAADAPNFIPLIESTIANALAAKLDNVSINGFASTHLDGFLDWSTTTGISETGSIGAILWEDIAASVTDVQTSNHEPNAYIVHPEIAGDLALIASGDATNSAKLWLGPPPHVAPLTQLVTTNISTASIVVGDFTQAAWGIRQGALVEVTTTGGDSFAKHQLLIKLTFRGDFNAFRRDAFHRLVGITT